MAPKRGRWIDDPASVATVQKRGRFGPRSAAAAGASTTPSADVVFEILSWLPARSLSRSRCVCTSWRAMISDPAFLAVRRSRAEPLLVAEINSGRGTTATMSLQIMDTDGDVTSCKLIDLGRLWKLGASIDGLVLLTSRHDDHSPAVRVIDLTTRERVASFRAEAADITWFGFGRAVESGALKVIRIGFRFSTMDDRWTCEVLTLGDGGSYGRWRHTGSPPASCSDMSDSATVNGVLHFLSALSTQQDVILCFDLESEEWTVIHGPSGTPSVLDGAGLAELNGALCLTHVKLCTVDLWLLTDIKKQVWVKAYTITMDHVVYLMPLRVMHPGGKLLFCYRRLYESKTVLKVYDHRSGKCTDVERAPTDIGRISLCSSHLDHRLRGQT
ncbi:hypothetical protein ACQ4PT_043487 [Festuca glaucescens]